MVQSAGSVLINMETTVTLAILARWAGALNCYNTTLVYACCQHDTSLFPSPIMNVVVQCEMPFDEQHCMRTAFSRHRLSLYLKFAAPQRVQVRTAAPLTHTHDTATLQ